MLADFFKYALSSMRHRKLRSWLTIVGIVVGIASIVVLVSVAQGLNEDIQAQLKAFGSQTVAIMPGATTGLQMAFSRADYKPPSTGKLYENDADRLERLEGVEYVSKLIQIRADVNYKGERLKGTLSGIEPSIFLQTQVLELEKGRLLVDTDRQVALVGNKIAHGYFDQDLDTGSIIRVGSEGKTYRVVGILKKAGGQAGNIIDSNIYVPIDDARDLAGDTILPNEISGIRLTIYPDADMEEMKQRIEFELLSAHKLKPEEKDFTIITASYIQEQVAVITGLLTMFLGGVALVSLLVGGVGIANTMFMAVLERTSEIGVLKATGADEASISRIFLIESGLIGGLGGLLGVVFGSLVSIGLDFAGVPTAVSPALVLFCFSFSLAVGIASGYFPAKRAARMNAVDALRSE